MYKHPLLYVSVLLLFFGSCSKLSGSSSGSNTNTSQNVTETYMTVQGDALKIHVEVPQGIDPAKPRPIIVLTHGTGSSEVNSLSRHPRTDDYLSQGLIVANFDFYGSDNTRNDDDGQHLIANYQKVLDYISANASRFSIDTKSIIIHGESGSTAIAIYTALTQNVMGVIVECGGRNAYYSSSPAHAISFAGIQTQSDVGFGGYLYTAADALAGNTANPKAAYPGDNHYCTAYDDCGLLETVGYLSAFPSVHFGTGNAYIKTIAGSDHCPGGSDWDTFMKNTPLQMLHDNGITW